MLSSVPEHSGELKNTGKKTRSGIEIKKPEPLIDYNLAKKEIEMSDQISSYHTCLRKTKKWYRKLAIEFLTGTSLVNAWVWVNKVGDKK